MSKWLNLDSYQITDYTCLLCLYQRTSALVRVNRLESILPLSIFITLQIFLYHIESLLSIALSRSINMTNFFNFFLYSFLKVYDEEMIAVKSFKYCSLKSCLPSIDVTPKKMMVLLWEPAIVSNLLLMVFFFLFESIFFS